MVAFLFYSYFFKVYIRHPGSKTAEQVGGLVADAIICVWQLASVYQTVSGLPSFPF